MLKRIFKNNNNLKYVICIILILILNILIRIPKFYHIGRANDTFFNLNLASSIVYNKYIIWVSNPFALAGLYPFSEPVGLPLFISELSLILGLPLEVVGQVISIFFAMMGLILMIPLSKTIFKSRIAVIFSLIFYGLTPAVLLNSYSMTSARQFIIFLSFPVLMWSLLRFEEKNDKKAFILLIGISFLSLLLHRLSFFIILFLLATFFLTKLIIRLKSDDKLNKLLFIGVILWLSFCLIIQLLELPIWTHGFYQNISQYNILNPGNDLVARFLSLAYKYVNVTGIELFITIIGFFIISVIKFEDKKIIFLYSSLLLAIPFLSWLYGQYIVFMTIILISAYVISKITKIKGVSIIFVIIILLTVGFADFKKENHFTETFGPWQESTYSSVEYVRNMGGEGYTSNDYSLLFLVEANTHKWVFGVPKNLITSRNEDFDVSFNLNYDNILFRKAIFDETKKAMIFQIYKKINEGRLDEDLRKELNINFFIQNKKTPFFSVYNHHYPLLIIKTLNEEKNKIFDTENEAIWSLG